MLPPLLTLQSRLAQGADVDLIPAADQVQVAALDEAAAAHVAGVHLGQVQAQVEGVLAGQGIVHQVAVLVVVAD